VFSRLKVEDWEHLSEDEGAQMMLMLTTGLFLLLPGEQRETKL